MHVALTQDHVIVALDLDLVAILGAEQHLIARFHRTNVGTHGHDLGPHQSLVHLGGGRDQDPAGGTALSSGPTDHDEHPIVEHLDRKFLAIEGDTFGEAIGGLRSGHVPTVPSRTVNDDTGNRDIDLSTSDGLQLEGQISIPAGARAAIVLCHPHPQQGGNMTSLVTSELFRVLPSSGYAVLRFNFRGVGNSQGTHDNGVGEALDIIAAIDAMSIECPDLPLFVSGWSFGADTSLSVLDPRIAAWIPCAPPLRILPVETLTAAAGSDPRPKLLIVPEHDQFRTPEAASEATSDWVETEVVGVAGADHFFVGRTDKVAKLIDGFVSTHI